MSEIVYKKIEIKVLVHTIMFNCFQSAKKAGAALVRTITSTIKAKSAHQNERAPPALLRSRSFSPPRFYFVRTQTLDDLKRNRWTANRLPPSREENSHRLIDREVTLTRCWKVTCFILAFYRNAGREAILFVTSCCRNLTYAPAVRIILLCTNL
jgi:hypothetical protein